MVEVGIATGGYRGAKISYHMIGSLDCCDRAVEMQTTKGRQSDIYKYKYKHIYVYVLV